MRRGAALLGVVLASWGALAAPSPVRRSVQEAMQAASSSARSWSHTWMGPKKNRATTIPQFNAMQHPGADPRYIAALAALPEKIIETRVSLAEWPAQGAEEAMRGPTACVLFSGFTVATCLSTANWGGAERSRKMLEDFALPLLQVLARKLPDAACIGVGLAYGAADLSHGASGVATKGEFVAIVAPRSALLELQRGSLTPSGMLQKSELFARYVDSESLKKVQLPLP